MTENDLYIKKSKMNLRSLRLSLKYRPKLLKLILKMRLCLRRRSSLLKSLKQRLNKLETNTAKLKDTDSTEEFQDSSTQTNDDINDQEVKVNIPKSDVSKKNAGWNMKENGATEKSIVEQVTEAAQSALQDSGMVYVESAGMYYDYKTGYYYNSELGLYYHSDTGCYYYYSDEKKFVFHSYPDTSKVNASLIAHQNKKARKLKRERKPEEDIDNLTKHLSQDKEEPGGNPKKPRKAKKTKKEKKEKKKSKKHKKTSDEKSSNDEKMEGIKEKEVEIDFPSKEGLAEDANIKTENVDNVPSEIKSQSCSENRDETSGTVEIFETTDSSKVTTDKDGVVKSIDVDIKNDDEIENEVKTEPKTENEVKDQDDQEMKKEETEEMEDGECSETDSEDSGSDSDSESNASTSSVIDEDSIAKQHPPCMRVIVRETKLPKLKVGSLFLVTKDGGTIGREGDQHAVLLRDTNVSRNHLDIRYDAARKTYVATDLGSKNGSILNGVRMSESQEMSLALDVLHGSTIQLGETKLLCHIHPGHNTCGQCEPGLLMQVEEEKKAAYTRTVSVKKQHELELARLKNIYVPQRLAIEEAPYNDRAQARRETVGSTNHAEKTQSTDLDTSLSSENKGFKLLQKMGWSEGEGLGKDSQGETEPVPLISNDGKAGLGTTGAVAPPSNKPKPRVIKNNLAAATMRLAARTKMLQPPAKAFQNEEEDDE